MLMGIDSKLDDARSSSQRFFPTAPLKSGNQFGGIVLPSALYVATAILDIIYDRDQLSCVVDEFKVGPSE